MHLHIADGQYRSVVVDDTEAEEGWQYFRERPVPRRPPEQRSLQGIGRSPSGSARQRKHHTDVSNCLITSSRYAARRETAIDHVPILYYNDRGRKGITNEQWAMRADLIFFRGKRRNRLFVNE